MTLQRLVINFTREGVEVRTLYRRRNQDGPGPNTKARRREVEELARGGLRDALEGRVDVIGTSGYEVREDTISALRGQHERLRT
jgi:hypothetical protein